jgi:O-antigen/teichoic acid export membrane protein
MENKDNEKPVIIKLISKISVVSFANILAGIIRNKVFALTLGAFGLGVIGQIVNLNAFISFFVSIGIPLGVTKFVSEWKDSEKSGQLNELLRSSLLILLGSSMLLTVLLVLFKKNISVFLFGTGEYDLLILYLSFSFPFLVVSLLVDAYVRGIKRHNIFTSISLINAVISTLIFVLLAIYYGEFGVGFAFFLSTLFSAIVSITSVIMFKLINFRQLFSSFSIKFSLLKSVIKLGIASLIIGAVNQFVFLYIRSRVIDLYGFEFNGFYQSVISISTSYFAVFNMFIGVHSLPALSEIKDNIAFNEEVNFSLKILMILVVPVVCLIFTFREIILPLLFSKEFLASSGIMTFFLLGDYFRVFSIVMGLWLIPKMKIKSWLFIEVSIYGLMFISFEIMSKLSLFGMNNFSVSYLTAYASGAVMHTVYIIFRNNFRFRKDILKLIIISTILVISLFVVSSMSIFWGYILILPLSVLWIAMNFTKNDFYKITSLLK